MTSRHPRRMSLRLVWYMNMLYALGMVPVRYRTVRTNTRLRHLGSQHLRH